MVTLGIIGLSTEWSAHYAPILKSLAPRVRIAAIYDHVDGRAKQAADELRCDHVRGIESLLSRPDIRAVLVLDGGWCLDSIFQRIYEHEKSAYLGGTFPVTQQWLGQQCQRADASNVTIMPELRLRFSTATSRLRELMVTQIGRAVRVNVQASVPGRIAADSRDFLDLIDWCRSVISTPPTRVEWLSPPGDQGRIRLTFGSMRGRAESPIVDLAITLNPGQPFDVRQQVVAAHGQAWLAGSERIEWYTKPDRPHDDDLEGDRSDRHRLLNHFCRRIAGGLVPVCQLADLRDAQRIAQAIRDSSSANQPVDV